MPLWSWIMLSRTNIFFVPHLISCCLLISVAVPTHAVRSHPVNLYSSPTLPGLPYVSFKLVFYHHSQCHISTTSSFLFSPFSHSGYMITVQWVGWKLTFIHSLGLVSISGHRKHVLAPRQCL